MDESNHPISLVSVNLFAELAAELLRQGKSVRFRAAGRSMYPTIRDGEVITVAPIEPSAVRKRDIILYRSGAGVVAHRVVRIIETELPPPSSLGPSHTVPSPHYSFVLRDDTWGTCLSRVEDHQILGKVMFVEREGRAYSPYTMRARIRGLIHSVASRAKRLVLGTPR